MRKNKRVKNIHKDIQLVLPTDNAHPYFSLKNVGKKVSIIHGKIRVVLSLGVRCAALPSQAPPQDALRA